MTQPIGSVEDLRKAGYLTGKVGSQPVCVWWNGGTVRALDDRCPHLGFPLHRGTVESGLLTCHWHNARFDLASGGTLDPWADDVRAYDVQVEGGQVFVDVAPDPDRVAHLQRRLAEGLEQGITLVIAKAVLGLLESGVDPAEIVRTGVEFGITYREAGWGAGLTVLTAMANVLASLDPADRALALVHGLAFVSRDTRGRPPRFPLLPLGAELPTDQAASWYRRFIDTRSSDAAERTLATLVESSGERDVAEVMFSAVSDHVFIDGGHTIDFTAKAFEAVDLLGWELAPRILSSLVSGTAGAHRSEEDGDWRHPHDLVAMLADVRPGGGGADVGAIATAVLTDEPEGIVPALHGATYEEAARAVALAAAMRLVRFHTQNDHGDWDEVHHAFTAANAAHQAVLRAPTALVARAVPQVALRVYLDRFLNVPAARIPQREAASLDGLAACFEREGQVDEAGAIVHGFLTGGGAADDVIGALGHALLVEDAEFHWFQTFEAAVRQVRAWPAGAPEAALILTGAARFLAAHTPTRRELSQVVRIATRLRRGESLFEEGDE